ncbi:MAG: hypothetical protein CVV27_04075 [Candidatus Melainabacteria bacterium HGW-Melainabacteria-1]|nr:MAG: hypothetical protein CVV27_04075 [Candidatus Melainabacteria bacterium HGW-Melainabacteria-1]
MSDPVCAQIEALSLNLPRYSRDALIARACKQHNARQHARAARLDDLYAEVQTISPSAHPNVLARVTVSYLRGLLEARYPILAGLRGDPAQFERYALAKAKMLATIAASYPWLADECQRQAV